jgi:hypothetical protein
VDDAESVDLVDTGVLKDHRVNDLFPPGENVPVTNAEVDDGEDDRRYFLLLADEGGVLLLLSFG